MVPEGLENAVREAQHEDVLDGLLPEIVVDPVDLLLGKDREQHAIQVAAGLEVVAERLLDDRPHPAVLDLLEPLGPDRLHDGLVGVGRRGEVEDAVAGAAALRLDLLELPAQPPEEARIAEVPRDVRHAIGKVAGPALRGRREFARPTLEVRAERLVRVLRPSDADDRKLRREGAVPVQVGDGGREKAPGEIARGAEDHECGRRPDLLLAPGSRAGGRNAHAADSRATAAVSPAIPLAGSAPSRTRTARRPRATRPSSSASA